MASESVSISCDECRLQNTSACDDCVVTFLCASEPAASVRIAFADRPDERSGAVIIEAAEARAVRMLQEAGLVPRLRFERRVG